VGRTTLHNLMNYQLTIVFSRGSLYLTVASNLLFSLLLYTAFGTITQIWLLSAHYLVITRIRDCVSILQGQEAGAVYTSRGPPLAASRRSVSIAKFCTTITRPPHHPAQEPSGNFQMSGSIIKSTEQWKGCDILDLSWAARCLNTILQRVGVRVQGSRRSRRDVRPL